MTTVFHIGICKRGGILKMHSYVANGFQRLCSIWMDKTGFRTKKLYGTRTLQARHTDGFLPVDCPYVPRRRKRVCKFFFSGRSQKVRRKACTERAPVGCKSSFNCLYTLSPQSCSQMIYSGNTHLLPPRTLQRFNAFKYHLYYDSIILSICYSHHSNDPKVVITSMTYQR